MFQNKNQSIVLENEIFKGLSPDSLTNYNLKNFIESKEGSIIYKPGDQSDFVYLVISGEVKLKIPGISGTPQILKRTANQYFGEKEVLEGVPRKSSSVADTDSLLYLLSKSDFAALLQSSTELKEKLTGGDKEVKEDFSIRRDILFSDTNEKITDLPFFKTDKVELNKNEYSSEDPFEEDPKVKEETPVNNDESVTPGEESTSFINESDPYDYPQNFPEFNSEPTHEINEIPNMENNSEDFFEDSKELDDISFNEDSQELSNIPEVFHTPQEFPEDTHKTDTSFEIPENDMEHIQNWTFGVDKENEEAHVPAINEDTYIDILLCIEKIGSSLVLDNLFNNIPSAVCQLISASSGTLNILDKEKGEFYSIEDSHTEVRIRKTEGLPGLCYINQDIINFNDDSIDAERNIILFPVENTKNEIVAVLQLNGSTKGFFDEGDQKIINAIMPFIADSIENAVRFDKDLFKERLKALGHMSNFLVNDIKRPLMMIRHYSEFLKQKFPDQDTLKILNLIAEQSEQIVDLVETSREFSDNNIIITKEKLEMTLIMDEYLTLLAEYTDSRKVKVFRKYEGQGSVNIDKKKLFHAFYQIVKNACDSMPQGGNIFFLIKREGASIEIQIKDEGKGINQEIQNLIFDPFVSYGKKNSAGLGLTLAHMIIEKHDGSITFISEVDKGSTFIISLPATD